MIKTSFRSLRPRRLRAAVIAAIALLVAVAAVPVVGAFGDPGPGDGTLAWNVTGRAAVSIDWPGADACGGAPCVELVDTEAPAAERAGCTSLGRPTFAVRCGLAGIDTLRVAGSGNLPVTIAVNAPASGCPEVDVVVVQGASNGPANVRDGCRQTVECAIYYAGTVNGDANDVVGDGCTKVRIDGAANRSPGAQDSCTTPGRGCAPDRGATPQVSDTEPITDPTDPEHRGPSARTPSGTLRVVSSSRLVRSGRSLRARVAITQPAQVNVTLQRRTPKGRWTKLRSTSRTGERGTTTVLFRSTGKRPIRPGTYRTRVVVSAPGTKPVTSKAVRVGR